MNIRPATAADAHSIAEVHVRAWQAAYQSIFPPATLQALSVASREELWRTAIAAGSPELLIAQLGDEIVGFVAFGALRIQKAEADQGEIWFINLDPAHWQKGIGKALMLSARQHLAAAGFRAVSLWVLEENARARLFYERLGLRLVSNSRKELVFSGTKAFEVLYEWHTDG